MEVRYSGGNIMKAPGNPVVQLATAIVLLTIILSLSGFAQIRGAGVAGKKGADGMLEKIHWLGHDCFRIDGEKVIYFDPFELGKDPPPADVIFISHDHSDHCSPKDVQKIQTKETVIVTTRSCAKKLSGEIKTVVPGDRITVHGLSVEAVPAYNVVPERQQYHPKEKGGVGFIVTLGGQRIYHAGDTDFIPEMKAFRPDIAFVPVSGKYVMNSEDALKAVRAMNPAITIPMHYGSIVGTDKDARALKQQAAPLRVEILESQK